MDGATHFTLKEAVEVAVTPTAVLTTMAPVVAPLGTAVVMLVADIFVTVAGVPWKVTCVTINRLVPLITTFFPIFPLAGVIFVMVGVPSVS